MLVIIFSGQTLFFFLLFIRFHIPQQKLGPDCQAQISWGGADGLNMLLINGYSVRPFADRERK